MSHKCEKCASTRVTEYTCLSCGAERHANGGMIEALTYWGGTGKRDVLIRAGCGLLGAGALLIHFIFY